MNTIADLHERLGRMVAIGNTVYGDDHKYDADASCLRGMTLSEAVCDFTPPEVPDTEFARNLQAKWDAEGAAYDRYHKSRNRAALTLELRAIEQKYGQ